MSPFWDYINSWKGLDPSHLCCVPVTGIGSSTQDELCGRNGSSPQNVRFTMTRKRGLRKLRKNKHTNENSSTHREGLSVGDVVVDDRWR